MPKLKVLTGSEIIKIFETLGFMLVSQRGSHAKLSRTTDLGKQVLTVPVGRELDRGAVQGIFRQAAHYISEDTLRSHFYTD